MSNLARKFEAIKPEAENKIGVVAQNRCNSITREYNRLHDELSDRLRKIRLIEPVKPRMHDFHGDLLFHEYDFKFNPNEVEESIKESIKNINVRYQDLCKDTISREHSVSLHFDLIPEEPRRRFTDTDNALWKEWEESAMKKIELQDIYDAVINEVGSFEDTAYKQMMDNIAEQLKKRQTPELKGKKIKFPYLLSYDDDFGGGKRFDWHDYSAGKLRAIKSAVDYFQQKNGINGSFWDIPGGAWYNDTLDFTRVYGNDVAGVKLYKNQNLELIFKDKAKAEQFFNMFKLGEE